MRVKADHDWLHHLPCGERIHEQVKAGLDPWFRGLIAASPTDVNRILAARWQTVPGFLRPLADRLLSAGGPALAGGRRRAYLRLTIDPRRLVPERPWEPRPWATPWRLLAEKARAFLRRNGIPYRRTEELADEDLEAAATELWDPPPPPPSPEAARADLLRRGMPADSIEGLGDRFLVFLASTGHYRGTRPETEDDWSWDLWLPPPIDPIEAGRIAERIVLPDPASILAFAVAFDGLRESPPRLAGSFVPFREWRTIREDGFDEPFLAGWTAALVLFEARNSDRVLLHPDGRLAWMVFAEHRMDERWAAFEDFIRDYADHLEYRWPFDSYGPSSQAVAARRARVERRGAQ